MNPEEKLAIAEQRLFDLRTGRLAIEVVQEGKGTVRYNRPTEDSLVAEIQNLKDQIANRKPRYGAIAVLF